MHPQPTRPEAINLVKDRRRANTDAMIECGGFGTPTIFVAGTDMDFGNDRLPLVRRAIAAAG